MNFLLIYYIFIGLCICADLIRFMCAKIVKLQIEEYSIFIGPKLICTTLYNTKFIIRPIPCGTSMTFQDSFLRRDRFSKFVFFYLPIIILFVVVLGVLTITTKNDVFITSTKIALLLHALQPIKSIIFDDHHVFYRYKM